MHRELSSSADRLVRRARILLIGATLLWGLSFPLVRALELVQRAHVPRVPDTALACSDIAMRFGVSALFLLPFNFAALRNLTRREWIQAVGLAVLAGGGIYLQTLGLAWTDASIAAFLTQLYTLIVPLIVALRDRRSPTGRVVLACILVLIGAALLSPGLLRHFTMGAGEIVILISTFFIAGQIVWVERPLFANNRPGPVTMIMFAVMSVMFGLGFVSTGGTPSYAYDLFDTPVLVGISLAVVFLCTIITFYIMNAWQRCISATEAGVIYCIEPVVAALLCGFLPGWISRLASIHYANETLTWSLAVGGVLIVVATILVATEKRA